MWILNFSRGSKTLHPIVSGIPGTLKAINSPSSPLCREKCCKGGVPPERELFVEKVQSVREQKTKLADSKITKDLGVGCNGTFPEFDSQRCDLSGPPISATPGPNLADFLDR